MTGYLVEVKITERKRFVIMAKDETSAETFALALAPDEENIDMKALSSVMLPVEVNMPFIYETETIDEIDCCQDIYDAYLDFTGEDYCEDDDSDDDDDYDLKEFFND